MDTDLYRFQFTIPFKSNKHIQFNTLQHTKPDFGELFSQDPPIQVKRLYASGLDITSRETGA